MFKNVASQKVIFFAYNVTTGAPVTGDGANQTPYVSKDGGAVTVLGTTTMTELDSTNAKGFYIASLAQAETNGNMLLFTAKSSTANVVLFACSPVIFTTPPNFPALAIDPTGYLTGNATPTQVAAVQTHGDANWLTATGFATPTQVAAVTTNVEAHGDSNWATATGFATPTQVAAVTTNVEAHGDSNWATATGFAVPGSQMDLVSAPNATAITAIQAGLATATDVTSAESAIIAHGDANWETGGSDPWLTALPGGYSAGQAGYILGHLGAAADPWATPLPGAYAPGQAGYIVGGIVSAVQAAVLDQVDGIDTGLTPREAVRLIVAAVAGQLAISADTVTIRDTSATKNRITATVDISGQRLAIVYDVT